MPTFNQLVRKGREVLEKKSTSPVLQKSYNSKKRVLLDQSSPQKRGVCTAIRTANTEEAQLRSAQNREGKAFQPDGSHRLHSG